MNIHRNICLVLAILLCTLAVPALAQDIAIDGNKYEDTIPVTPENFTDVDAEVNFFKWKSKDAMNKLFHLTVLTPAGPMPTVRMNRDTLYSAGLVDASNGFKVHMPDQGIFTSFLVIDQKGYSQDYIWKPGTHQVNINLDNGTFAWVLFRIGLEKGIEKALEAQKTVAISDMGDKVWSPQKYNKEQHQVLREKYMTEAIESGMFLEYGYEASRIDIDTKRKSDAAGWGGMDFGINSYQISKNMKSDSCYSTTFEDPAVDEFWSFTLYDADGWLLPVDEKNVLNSRNAVPNEDGTFTVRFNCGKDAVNNLETKAPVFGFAWRTYGSSYKVRAGRWNPINSLVKSESLPIIVTQDNFPQAYTNMRFSVFDKKAGGVNKFLKMPVPPSDPEKQLIVRMNRDTPYSLAVVDMSSGSVYITIPETDKYVTTQIIDENHETQPMIYGSGRHKLTAKTDYAFVAVRTLDGPIRDNLVLEAGSAKPFEVKKWDMESFRAVDKAGNIDFADGYDQSKAFGNVESGQTPYMNYVGAAGGWGGAMVEDNIYQTTQYFEAEGCYEMTFVDPKDTFFWSATVYNGDGRMFNDIANISSEMNPVKNADGTYTLRFGCDGQPNNIPIVEGNTTGKFNVLMRHYGPSEEVSNNVDGYNVSELLRKVK